ncbi:MAG TPA: hypothetical protein VFX58_03310 [Chitinophagaceae bacterium]|nr:hypothetical protein [Chitinophagaceae bacterium]
MANQENLGSFIKETTRLAKDYVETRLEIGRLKSIRIVAITTGYILWVTISLFLLFLLLFFIGIVGSLWLSERTGSYIYGFGITTLVILGIILILALARKVLFINPIIRAIIKRTTDHPHDTDQLE